MFKIICIKNKKVEVIYNLFNLLQNYILVKKLKSYLIFIFIKFKYKFFKYFLGINCTFPI
jgi:hypothetical protein